MYIYKGKQTSKKPSKQSKIQVNKQTRKKEQGIAEYNPKQKKKLKKVTTKNNYGNVEFSHQPYF